MEQLKEQHPKHTELAAVLHNSVTSVALQLGDEEEENALLSEMQREAVKIRQHIAEIVRDTYTCIYIVNLPLF